jgi:L-alanine-DL-glutamate epimerase-like enolase superfamily enzyme
MVNDRRNFLKMLGAGALVFAEPYQRAAAALRNKVKITDVKCMTIRGTWDWNLVKIETDAGVYGIGEAYWGVGIKDLILRQLKPIILGQDPLNVDKLYTLMLMRSEGSGAIGGQTVSAASGIEIALWDLAGRILETPVCNLLGGRFRDKVRFYRTLQLPKGNVAEASAWRDQMAEARAEKWNWTAFKVQGNGIPSRLDPGNKVPGHDPFSRGLSPQDIRHIANSMDFVRDALGPDIPFAVDLHWHYDVQDAIALGKALEHVNLMWMEDPLPPENAESMAVVARSTTTPICTGENLYGAAGFRRLIEDQACAGVHIDIPKSGGLLQAKRISDLADLYYMFTAAHNPASPVGTAASAHAAASMRGFRIHELANWVDWWPDLVIREGPYWEDGYFTIQDKPGLGLEINPDVAKAHLAPGEVWWG